MNLTLDGGNNGRVSPMLSPQIPAHRDDLRRIVRLLLLGFSQLVCSCIDGVMNLLEKPWKNHGKTLEKPWEYLYNIYYHR